MIDDPLCNACEFYSGISIDAEIYTRMERDTNNDSYELSASSPEKRRTFGHSYRDSSASALNSSTERKDSITEYDDFDSTEGTKTPLVATRVVDASTSSAGASRMSLQGEVAGEGDIRESIRADERHPEYQLYKRRWVGVVALVSFARPFELKMALMGSHTGTPKHRKGSELGLVWCHCEHGHKTTGLHAGTSQYARKYSTH